MARPVQFAECMSHDGTAPMFGYFAPQSGPLRPRVQVIDFNDDHPSVDQERRATWAEERVSKGVCCDRWGAPMFGWMVTGGHTILIDLR